MTKLAETGPALSRPYGFSPRPEPPQTTLKSVCEAAGAAIAAFDEGARRGDSFATLCELSESERRAVVAACGFRAETPAELAQKALLLDKIVRSGAQSHPTLESLALSLAADAVALARSMTGGGRAKN